MRRLILGLTFAAASSMALANGADGLWKTEVGDDGGYLEVTISSCDADATKTCGKISKAFSKDGEDPKYANLGKLMIKDMKSDDGESYAGGTIWDPEKDKTYKSKMSLNGDTMDVKGCISIICTGQQWTRVK